MLQSIVENRAASPRLSIQSSIRGRELVSATFLRFRYLYVTRKRNLPFIFGARTTDKTHLLSDGSITLLCDNAFVRSRITSRFAGPWRYGICLMEAFHASIRCAFCSSNRFKMTIPHSVMFQHHLKYPCSLRIVFGVQKVDSVCPVVLRSRFFFVVFLTHRDSFKHRHSKWIFSGFGSR